MIWNRAQLIAWLDATEPKVDTLTPFELLEIPPTASGQHIQRAFHAIAATRHPDVWRNHLDAAERERLIHVYGRVTAAYATLRNEEQRARVLREVRERRPTQPPIATAATERGDLELPRRHARTTMPTEPPAMPTAAPVAGTNATLGARALGFYRRAEAAMRVGDLAGALLNLRMALAAEPSSQLLKDAIADTQRKLKK
jgi:curved DNA-binding protein CbpA